jgi:hypothetical protein
MPANSIEQPNISYTYLQLSMWSTAKIILQNRDFHYSRQNSLNGRLFELFKSIYGGSEKSGSHRQFHC